MVCLDTSFLVDLTRKKQDAVLFFQDLSKDEDAITIASPSIIELISSALLNRKKDEKKEVIEILSSLTVLPLDLESALLAGEIEAELILAGETVPSLDIMIGAIAKTNKEILVTRNKKHFEKIRNLKIESY